MNPHITNILVLDDEPEIRCEINEFLTSRNMNVIEAGTPEEAFCILSKEQVDIAILDIRLPEMNGIEFLKKLRKMYPYVQAIMISGHGDMNSVIDALRNGAMDYFQKPFLLNEMLKTIEKARKYISYFKPADGNPVNHLFNNTGNEDPLSFLIVSSKAMKSIVEKMRLVARAKDTTVLITGESGTGKELIAKGIHDLSSRKNKPFHAVNCSTIPDELFESEFFGYKKGAFTGAHQDKTGWFEAADGGTLFLDEIGDLKPNLQAKLLRIMEDQNISKLGTTASVKIDIRVIAATNQDLELLIRQNRFRQDLYHRINTFIINIPPLRQRLESIPTLFLHYLNLYCKKFERKIPEVDNEVIYVLQSYDFPGNVRELKHMIERALILCENDKLTLEHFDHLKIKMASPLPELPDQFTIKPLTDIEMESIKNALIQAGNNKSKAARLLKISRQSLDRKLERLGIVVSK